MVYQPKVGRLGFKYAWSFSLLIISILFHTYLSLPAIHTTPLREIQDVSLIYDEIVSLLVLV